MIDDLHVARPLLDLAEMVEASYGAKVEILDLPLLDPEGEFGLSFVPRRPEGAAIWVTYASGVFSLFFENITEERDSALDPEALGWMYEQISAIATKGITRRRVPWARGLLSKIVVYFGDDPGGGDILDQWGPW